MRRILIGVAAAIVAVVAIIAARALSLAPPGPDAPPTPPIPVDARSVAQHLGAAVRFKTVSFGDSQHEVEQNAALDAMRSWLAKTYPNFHKAVTREVIGESLLFTWKGANPALAPILLMAHMDVVPIVPGSEKSWSHAPFSGDVAGGYVWGRGSIDDKGSLIMILEAAERLAKTGFVPERTIMFAFGQDEEVGGTQGNGAIADTLERRGVHFDFVLDEGGSIVDEPFPGVQRPVALVAVAEKGYLTLDLVAHGEGGHSSRPTHDMAVVRLAEAVLKVVNHPFASGLDDIQRERLSALAPLAPFPQRILLANLWLFEPLVDRLVEMSPEGAARLHTTIAPTMIAGGIKDNVLPPEARATVNFRLQPRDTIESVVEHVRKAIDDPKVDVIATIGTQDEASKAADLNGAQYKFLTQQIQGSFNGIPVAPDTTTGATDSRHYLPIADAVFRFVPFRLGADDLARIHGTNERLAVRDLAPAVAFYMRLMQNAK